jgi:hypothetical protein
LHDENCLILTRENHDYSTRGFVDVVGAIKAAEALEEASYGGIPCSRLNLLDLLGFYLSISRDKHIFAYIQLPHARLAALS